ncbi:hypothetical protein RFI_14812, partial [Reticulomyxa filosa]
MKDNDLDTVTIEERANEITSAYNSGHTTTREQAVQQFLHELKTPLIGPQHHSVRHQKITVLLNLISGRSDEASAESTAVQSCPALIREKDVLQLLLRWLRGEGLPHGMNVKKHILSVIPNVLYHSYKEVAEWPFEIIQAYLWDKIYDRHWCDNEECRPLTDVIKQCFLKPNPSDKAAIKNIEKNPFAHCLDKIEKECIFRYQSVQTDELTQFRLALDFIELEWIQNDLKNNLLKWFHHPKIDQNLQVNALQVILNYLQFTPCHKELFEKLLQLNYPTSIRSHARALLGLLFKRQPLFYQHSWDFLLNVKPSEVVKYNNMIDLIVSITPNANDNWSHEHEYKFCPSYLLGAAMAVAMEVHSWCTHYIYIYVYMYVCVYINVNVNVYLFILAHRPTVKLGLQKMITAKKFCSDLHVSSFMHLLCVMFLQYKRFNLTKFAEAYLLRVTNESTSKVK